ncbi:MAG: hypothetical protein GXC94_07260 [Comamonadaceae bacterium]|nr:hypothetical protein [Comamonadaceae bacterium]
MKKLRIALACTLLATLTPVAHAQFGLGIFNAATNVLNRAAGKMLNNDKPTDIEAERTKYFAKMEEAIRGLSAADAAGIRKTMEGQWDGLENVMLMRNAQVAREKSAPVFDLKAAAMDISGGAALSANLSRGAFGDNGFGSMLQSAALNGVVSGMGGEAGAPAAAMPGGIHPAMAGAMATGSMPTGAAMSAAAQNAVTAPVSNAIASRVGGVVQGLFGGSKAAGLGEPVHPTRFFNRHPSELSRDVVRREAGNIGWKRIQHNEDGSVEVFAPVMAEDSFKAVVFSYDPQGAVVGAFRMLKAGLTDFRPLADEAGKLVGVTPTFASGQGVLRAVWSDGAFLTADASSMSFGWSVLTKTNFGQLVAATAGATSQ